MALIPTWPARVTLRYLRDDILCCSWTSVPNICYLLWSDSGCEFFNNDCISQAKGLLKHEL